MKYFAAIIIIVLFAIQGCEPDPVIINEETSDVKIGIAHSINQKSFSDTKELYYGANEEKFTITKMHYLISAITLKNSNGTIVNTQSANFIDMIKSPNAEINLNKIPNGNYSEITFYFGVDPARNKTGMLPNEDVFNNFEWPLTNGGGYHFCQLEGNYDYNGLKGPYNVHLGKNPNQAKFTFPINIKVGSSTNELFFKLNIDEFFKNPNTVIIDKKLGSIMENDSLQTVFSQNVKDIFTFKGMTKN